MKIKPSLLSKVVVFKELLRHLGSPTSEFPSYGNQSFLLHIWSLHFALSLASALIRTSFLSSSVFGMDFSDPSNNLSSLDWFL